MFPRGSNWVDWLSSASLPTIHHPFNYGTMIHAALVRLLFFKGTRMGLDGRQAIGTRDTFGVGFTGVQRWNRSTVVFSLFELLISPSIVCVSV